VCQLNKQLKGVLRNLARAAQLLLLLTLQCDQHVDTLRKDCLLSGRHLVIAT
jgi:hypothetical protein